MKLSSVSIVIPTRNRANLLRYALGSALRQDHGDFEVVISDNNSGDETAAVAKSFRDERVRYVRSDSTLSMPESWEFALDHAEGRYLTVLADDCYLFPRCVSTALQELGEHDVDVAVWKFCAYFDAGWLEPGRRNIVYVPKTSGRRSVLDSESQLARLFEFDQSVTTSIPKFLNSLCSRDVVNDIRRSQQRVFIPSCPDYTSAVAIMLQRPSYVLIDQPLYIDGVTTASVGATASFDMSASAREMLSEFTEDMEDLVLLGIPTSPSGIAASLDAVSRLYPGRCRPLNSVNVLGAVVDRLVKIEGNGGDVARDWGTLGRHLSTLSVGDRWAILRRKLISRLTWAAMRVVRGSSRLEGLEALRHVRIIRGSDWGFTNIEECAKMLIEKGLVDPVATRRAA